MELCVYAFAAHGLAAWVQLAPRPVPRGREDNWSAGLKIWPGLHFNTHSPQASGFCCQHACSSFLLSQLACPPVTTCTVNMLYMFSSFPHMLPPHDIFCTLFQSLYRATCKSLRCQGPTKLSSESYRKLTLLSYILDCLHGRMDVFVCSLACLCGTATRVPSLWSCSCVKPPVVPCLHWQVAVAFACL